MNTPNITYNDIRPYLNSEIQEALRGLLKEDEFKYVISQFAPQLDLAELEASVPHFQTIFQFQKAVVAPILKILVEKLCTGFTSSGVELLTEPGILMSNHRDIVIDPTFLCYTLILAGRDTCEIGIGDNLLKREWIKTLVRLNKSFIVKRDLQPKEMAKTFVELSGYINHTIKDNDNYIWIAQREGRAKDSNDRTQESILKMFALGGEGNFIESLKNLNIYPLCISYEYDPCDYLKAKEYQQRRDNENFKKDEKDDLTSMQTGIMGYKGHIHYAFTPCINPQLDEIAARGLNRKEQSAEICRICDEQIFSAYKIYAINMVAYDILLDTDRFAGEYTVKERAEVEKYLMGQLEKIEVENKDGDYLMRKMLEMYANPLINQLSVTK